MAISWSARKAAKEYLRRFLDSAVDDFVAKASGDVSERVVDSDGALKPFHMALLPAPVTRLNAFERSFSTALGSSFEAVAELIARDVHQEAQRQYNLEGKAPAGALSTIQTMVNDIKTQGWSEAYPSLVERVVAGYKSDLRPRRIKIDLYIKTRSGQVLLFEMKSPKPNMDQCLGVTEKLLAAHAVLSKGPPDVSTFYGMSYNPYGPRRSDYRWTYARRYLDFDNQVRIGEEFWEVVGGPGTYVEVLKLYAEVGEEARADVLRKMGF